jgi:hypothetical protein
MATTPDEIRCPKCNSNQLTANKKGFSGKKAIAGALLTGGVGLLAGTIGSNKIRITCLACGHVFKPREGSTNAAIKTVVEEKPSKLDELEKYNEEHKRIFGSADNMEEALLKILKEGLVRGAVNHYQNLTKVSKEEATEYVEKFIVDHNLSDQVKRKGCFIATACYSDFNAPEVLVLRQYRDEKLMQTSSGKIFVSFYYLVSPPLANIISHSDILKSFVRITFLEPFVKKLTKQSLIKS